MITNLRIQNFKALKDTTELRFKPLTLLIGPNSSGKSSILQSLLMLRQTVVSSDTKTALILDDYVRLGSFRNIVWNHDGKNVINLRIGSEDTFWELSFSVLRTGRTAGSIYLKRLDFTGSIPVLPKYYGKEPITFSISKEPKKKSYRLTLSIPCELTVGSLSVGRFDKFIASYPFRRKLQKEIESHLARRAKGEKKYQRVQLIMGQIMYATDFLSFLLKQISHVGPLREEPQPLYASTGALPKEVGKRGQWAITTYLQAPKTERQQIDEWLKRLGMVSQFKVKQLGRHLRFYEARVQDSHTGVASTILDVGFGLSQILPLVVQSVCMGKDELLLIEQPEIHLHPKAQAEMGSFFVDQALRKKRFIIETHSELLLSRICTHIAEKRIRLQDVAVYYFDPTSEGTKVLTININEKGEYENFPEGFFEESYKEALSRMKTTLAESD